MKFKLEIYFLIMKGIVRKKSCNYLKFQSYEILKSQYLINFDIFNFFIQLRTSKFSLFPEISPTVTSWRAHKKQRTTKTCSLFKVTRYLCKQRKRNETLVYCRWSDSWAPRKEGGTQKALDIAQNESRSCSSAKKKGSDGKFSIQMYLLCSLPLRVA